MLNPPLSNLSNELFALIVEEVSDDVEYMAIRHLKRLSIVDRAFTFLCQSHLFKELKLDGNKSEMTKTLKRVYDILKTKEESSVSFVRRIRLDLDEQKDVSWLFQDKTFTSLMKILAKAPRPPHALELFGWDATTTKKPESIVEGLANSFFSKSLESLSIWNCHIPPSTLLVSPVLRRLELYNVQLVPSKKSANSGNDVRQLPKLLELDHRLSHDIVRRFLPTEGVDQLADVSQLQVLHMCPEDEENMALAQPLLDVAHETLQEIKLKHSFLTPGSDSEDEQHGYLLLAGLLNLKKLHQLRVFELRTGVYDSDPDRLDVVKDITTVLRTLPQANSLAYLYIRVQVFGEYPFKEAKSQKWSAFAKEIIRLSGGKPLTFELDMDTQSDEGDPLDDLGDGPDEGQMKELYDHVEKELKALKTAEGIEMKFKNEITDGLLDESGEDEDDPADSDSDVY